MLAHLWYDKNLPTWTAHLCRSRQSAVKHKTDNTVWPNTLHFQDYWLNSETDFFKTHTLVCFLWIVGTFHRLLLLLYWPNDIFYPLTLTENLFSHTHTHTTRSVSIRCFLWIWYKLVWKKVVLTFSTWSKHISNTFYFYYYYYQTIKIKKKDNTTN